MRRQHPKCCSRAAIATSVHSQCHPPRIERRACSVGDAADEGGPKREEGVRAFVAVAVGSDLEELRRIPPGERLQN